MIPSGHNILCNLIKTLYLQPLLILGDLAKEADTKNILEKTIEHYGKLNVLVCIFLLF